MLITNSSVQRALKAAGFYAGAIDGAFGPKSLEAARLYAATRSGKNVDLWSPARVRLAVEQAIMTDAGFYRSSIDGIAGPATQVAAEKWQDHITFDRPSPNPGAGVPASTVWPRQNDLRAFYGNPGENQTMLVSPYPLYLDWDLNARVSKFSIHEKCHDSALRVMNRVLSHYGENAIHRLGLDQFGGCLNVRKMRNGTAWSTHAWGIAIDWDADRNPLRTSFARSQMGKPEYSKFLDLWEEEGWVSLGRARNFDAMHVQAARL